MSVLEAIFLGIIQGITEFIPVSSFGHISIIQNLMDIEHGPGVLFETMLHIGTLFAIIMAFRKDVRMVAIESVGFVMDCIGNLTLYIHNKRTGEQLHYTKVINSTYRKFAVLIMVSTIPTVMLGYTARRLVSRYCVSPLLPAIGILITGIVMLVVDFSGNGGKKAAKDADFGNAMWIGICQGISIFPGFCRSGLTISAALLCGFSRTFAVKYSYIMSVPAVIGAFLMEVNEFTSPRMSVGLGFTFVLGMIAAGVVGYFSIRFLLKLVHKIKLRYFAYYCFVAGIYALCANYLL